MHSINKNTCLENVLNKNKDQLRNFNDLKKEDVITTVQRLVAKKYVDDLYFETNVSAETDQLHYTLTKDEAKKIESEYQDKDSERNDFLSSKLGEEVEDLIRDEISTYDECYNAYVETEIEEISVDQLARRKYAFHSTINLADELKDHSLVDNNDKNKVLEDLNLDKDSYAVELVLKENVPTFVIVENEKSVSGKVKDTIEMLSSNISDVLATHLKLDDIVPELYNNERSMYESLKIFFERFDKEVNKDDLHSYDKVTIKDLRNHFMSLKTKSEISN